MGKTLKLDTILPASSEEIYNAWLDAEKHGEMTGHKATGQGGIGEPFTAWDNYITGKTLELAPNMKIVQSWRTDDFKKNDADSLVEIYFEQLAEGCKLKLIHSNIPENQPDYAEGWRDFYFKPMLEYFSK